MISYIETHRNGLKKAAGITGGLYLMRGYIKARLEEVKEKMEQERLAKDVLQRRYEQTQDDVGYTVMALLSNLGEQILEEMDVEAIIAELQMMSNKSLLPVSSDSMSASVTSSASEPNSLNTSGLQGWVDATEAQAQSQAGDSSSEEASSVMSSSFITNLSTESEPSSSSASVASLPSNSSASTPSRTKAQLWNSVKLLTFTRTLTTIYSISLLTLFTLTQLTILARMKYIHAIRHMSSEEEQDAALQSEMTMPNMLLMAFKARLGIPQQPLLQTFFPSAHSLLFAPGDDDAMSESPSSDMATFENMSADYLTLSYYLLHIGWKDLSIRVQPAVEDALVGVSLKTRLTRSDVHRLLKDIMHRVALEGSFDASMLPNTEEMVRNVLVLGGRDDHDPYSSAQSSSFDGILSETRALFATPQFSEVLDACVESAVDNLMDSLEGDGRVFAPGDDADPPRVRLASILPPLASWSRNSLLALPSELVDGILAKNETRTFSAWVWARFELEV